MMFNYNDGGREAAGFKHKKNCGDCVCRAIAIATERKYEEIYALILHYAKTERTSKRKRSISDPEKGVYRNTHKKVMELLGWEWIPTMGIGTGCKVHLREGELPACRIVVDVSHHFTAVVDGVINDTFDPARGGNRCVYGYYRATDKALKPTDPLPISVDVVVPVKKHNAKNAKTEKSHTDVKTLQTARREIVRRSRLYTDDGWRIFMVSEMRLEVESLIPYELRPYYTGCEVTTEHEGRLTADNSEIFVYFRKPVCGSLSDVRYVHGRLLDMPQELDSCFVDDNAEGYEDYDDEYGNRQVKEIRVKECEDRNALRLSWRREEHNLAS